MAKTVNTKMRYSNVELSEMISAQTSWHFQCLYFNSMDTKRT